MRFKILLLVTILIFSFSIVKSQTFSESRKLTRIFKVENATVVNISNKYGNIQVETWSNDSLRIEINFSVKTTSESSLKKLLSSIDFEFEATEEQIVAKTVLSTSGSNFFTKIFASGEEVVPESNNVKINYSVKIPEKMNLNIENKFGDIFLGNLSSDFTLDLSNGDLKAGNLNGTNSITIKFGDAVVNSVQQGKLEISYSNFETKNSDILTVDSKSSKIVIGKINEIKTISKRDKYYITDINKFEGETSFSDLWVTHLRNELNFKMSYGTLNIESIKKTFSLLNVSSQYTNLNLSFEKYSEYKADITHFDVSLNLPKEYTKFDKQTIDPVTNKIQIHGIVGKHNPDSRLNIYAEHSNINIIHK